MGDLPAAATDQDNDVNDLAKLIADNENDEPLDGSIDEEPRERSKAKTTTFPLMLLRIQTANEFQANNLGQTMCLNCKAITDVPNSRFKAKRICSVTGCETIMTWAIC